MRSRGTGTLAWKNGEPSVHRHGVAGDAGFATVGGHLLGLEVGTGSLEITITLHERRLEREVDPHIGANILSLGAD
jgi:predicted DNA-binding protein with PD1-like motif